jgi:TolB-like protein
MKRCPQCNRVETDDTLAFCRVDGTALISDSGSVAGDADTAKFEAAPASSEIETSILPHTSKSPEINHATAPTTVLPAQQISGTTRKLSKTKRLGILIALAGLGVIVIAVAGYFYYSRKNNTVIGSIAVLPFVNQNSDTNIDYLADGITESIINSLSQLPNLKVMSRNSVFHYKGKDPDAQAVAKELNVQAVLTGRVTQRGDGLLINVELINAQDNSQIWGQQYNRKLADVFSVQEEIAREISEKLRLRLTGAERQQLAKRPTENLRAFQYYMQGRAYNQRSTREDQLMAIRYCEKAIEEDRNYALAYTGLSEAYLVLGARGFVAPIEGRRRRTPGSVS